MHREVFFHPYHVVPAVELVGALVEMPRETVADMLVKFPAVFRQIGIVCCARRH